MYLMVFLCRYVDLLMYRVSVYNTVMKLVFISATLLTICLMRYLTPYCSSYNAEGDYLPHVKYLLPVALVMTLFFHKEIDYEFDSIWYIFSDWMLSFSWWLEALTFLPQLVMLKRMRRCENLTYYYVLCLGLYRYFYILNW